MPGSSVAIGAGSSTAAEEAAAAAAGNTEIRFEPGTRVVVDEALPVPGETIGAQWYRTVTSRSSAAGVTTELAELKCYISLTDLVTRSHNEEFENQIIGADDNGKSPDLAQVTSAMFGTVLAGTMVCLEKPTVGDTTIDIVAGRSTFGLESGDDIITAGDYADSKLTASGGWDAGDVLTINVDNLNADESLFLVGGGVTAGTYGAGKFLLTFQCRYTVPYLA